LVGCCYDVAGQCISTYSPVSCAGSGGHSSSGRRRHDNWWLDSALNPLIDLDAITDWRAAAMRVLTASRIAAAFPPLDDRGRSGSTSALRTPCSRSHGSVAVRGRIPESSPRSAGFSESDATRDAASTDGFEVRGRIAESTPRSDLR